MRPESEPSEKVSCIQSVSNTERKYVLDMQKNSPFKRRPAPTSLQAYRRLFGHFSTVEAIITDAIVDVDPTGLTREETLGKQEFRWRLFAVAFAQ